MRVACAHCGHDWVRCYERKDTGQRFFLFRECESVWDLEDDLHEDTDMHLSEYLLTGDSAKDVGDHHSVRLRKPTACRPRKVAHESWIASAVARHSVSVSLTIRPLAPRRAYAESAYAHARWTVRITPGDDGVESEAVRQGWCAGGG